MELTEIAAYFSLGFIPALLTLEVGWKLALRKGLACGKKRDLEGVTEIGVR